MQTASVFASIHDCSNLNTPELLGGIEDGLIEPRDIDVLIIEDDSSDFRITSKTLQMMDTFRANIFHAPDLVAARGMSTERTFDVVLVDFCLGMDTGTRAIQELGGRIGSAALILLTGMPGQDIREIALKAGAIHCIDKNQLNPVLLETTIRSALHTHALETKLQEMIVELELANRGKTDFFARIGHDLKTPLNAALGYAEMISEQTFGPEAGDKYVECSNNIRTAGAHLLEVLDNLIHHAANESSYSDGHREIANLCDLVQNAISMVDVLARARKHDVKFVPPDCSVPVNCKSAVLTQAVVNVLSNAIKYTPAGGNIAVSASRAERHAVIRVQDNGIGMSRDDIDVALTPFGRVSLPPQFSQDGTGIGLPIVRDIVAAHGGHLEIESARDKGTTIILQLPIASPAESADQPKIKSVED